MSLHSNGLLTRDAEGLFWMARYLERVENMARLIDVTQTFEGPGGEAGSWSALLSINADGDKMAGRPINAETVKSFYLLEHENPHSVPASLEFARTNARTLRPLISTEMWMQLNMFHRSVMSTTQADLEGDALSRLCRHIKEGVQAHTGITEGTFPRDQGWHFYLLGRLIERADQVTRLLDIKYHLLVEGSGEERRLVDLTQWNAVLRAAAGYHAFRRVAQAGFEPWDVVSFLLSDTTFARSASLCVQDIGWHLEQLRARYNLRDTAGPLEQVDELRMALREGSGFIQPGGGLHDFLDGLQKDLNRLASEIGTAFFRDWRPLRQTQTQSQQS
ncbi:MAG: alpha-E domain-containing protein [Acetobacteraceae bacterium]|nr:alpha-E domain-containing protein [Acetobacteraceae bacterium]